MRNTTRHLPITPARPAQDVEAFVLDVHRTHTSWCYWPAQPGQARRVEYSEAQAGTYPVRVETSPVGDLLAVVDLDTFVMRRITWRWIFPRIERPCVRAVSDVAWLTDEVIDGAPAMTDDDGTPLATFRRISGEVFLELDGVVMKTRTDDPGLDDFLDDGWREITREEAMTWQPTTDTTEVAR